MRRRGRRGRGRRVRCEASGEKPRSEAIGEGERVGGDGCEVENVRMEPWGQGREGEMIRKRVSLCGRNTMHGN